MTHITIYNLVMIHITINNLNKDSAHPKWPHQVPSSFCKKAGLRRPARKQECALVECPTWRWLGAISQFQNWKLENRWCSLLFCIDWSCSWFLVFLSCGWEFFFFRRSPWSPCSRADCMSRDTGKDTRKLNTIMIIMWVKRSSNANSPLHSKPHRGRRKTLRQCG